MDVQERKGNIGFNFHSEANITLPFLDVLVMKRGPKLSTRVYRNATHTGRYLHFKSNHLHRVVGISHKAVLLREKAKPALFRATTNILSSDQSARRIKAPVPIGPLVADEKYKRRTRERRSTGPDSFVSDGQSGLCFSEQIWSA
jgi:hypothetical protein